MIHKDKIVGHKIVGLHYKYIVLAKHLSFNMFMLLLNNTKTKNAEDSWSCIK